MKENTENDKFIFDRPIKCGLTYYWNYIKLWGQSLFFKTLFHFASIPKTEKKYKYCICSIFKNESPYLREFVEYHLLIGFEHFYFYNNNSDDNYQEVLRKYVEKGIVSLIDWPVVPGQQAMYEHWYKTFRHETQWVAFLDLDEFICLIKAVSIDEWIKPFERFPLIMLYWRMFGTSGILENDNTKLVIEQYFNSWNKLTNIGKLIYNTDYDIAWFEKAMMHYFYVHYKRMLIPPINQYGYFVRYGIHRYSMREDEIQVNHYWSKSYNNYTQKHKRGSAVYGKSWKTFDAFLFHEHFNISCDFNISRFLTELKLKMTGQYPNVNYENSKWRKNV